MSDLPYQPKISVITVTKNNLANLKKTLASIQEQEYPHIECIVVDGASSDGTGEWLNMTKDSNVLWHSEEDQGLYDAMNKGFKKSTGNWVHFLNAGDTFVNSQTVSQIVQSLSDHLDFLYTDVFRAFDEERLDLWRQKQPRNFGVFNNICHQAMWYNRKLNLNFDLNFKISADCHLLMSYLFNKDKKVYRYLPMPCVAYQMGGISQKYAMEALIEREKSFDLFIKNPVFRWMNQVNLSRQKSKLQKHLQEVPASS